MTWEQFRHLHTDPRVIAIWRWLFGPLLRWLTPARRRLMLGLGALIVSVKLPFGVMQRVESSTGLDAEVAAGLLLATLIFTYVSCCYLAARRFASLPAVVRRRPLMFLHSAFWVLLIALWTRNGTHPTLIAALTGCAIAIPFLVWRLSYLMQTAQRGRLGGSNVLDHALYIWPVWGGSNTPYGKGFDYLKSTEAGDEESLARSQLAGLKLFVLALVCNVGVRLINGIVFGADNVARRTLGGATLGLPTVDALLGGQAGTHPIWVCWVAVYCDLVLQVLKLGVYGHVVVGYLRLCGFNVFRNTYKPLLAETIVEFWNRYYYYFKELLVHFFFFPTFIRYFRHSPRLRLFTAVFASACLGNLYYHVIQDESLVRGDWAGLAHMAIPRAGYCVLLALGIYFSMQREQRRPRSDAIRPWSRRALAILGVWTFFAFIRIFHHGNPDFRSRIEFVAGMFGLA